jgi:trimeric autotransporter adhesin
MFRFNSVCVSTSKKWLCALFTSVFLIAGCGGGGSSSSTNPCKEALPRSFSSVQISAMGPTEVATLNDLEIIGLGSSISLLSNSALATLNGHVSNPNVLCFHVSQILAITPDQIAALSAAQVRQIGATGNGGVAQLDWLNADTWSRLTSNPTQVAAITSQEVPGLSSPKVAAMGLNIQYLTNAALDVLEDAFIATTVNQTGQIQSITAGQMGVLTVNQVHHIGYLENSVAKIASLSNAAWSVLLASQPQVAAITAAEMQTLSTTRFQTFGSNLQYLSDPALGAIKITFVANPLNSNSQYQVITAAQIQSLTPTQILALAGDTKIAALTVPAFGALSPPQVAGLVPVNVTGVSAAQLAALTDASLAAFSPATKASFTPTQKSLLTSTQHTSCGC